MKIKLKVNVTEDHIYAAQCFKNTPSMSRSACCPIALAVADMGYPDARVGMETLTTERGMGYEVWGLLPIEAIGFVQKFDTHGTVDPFCFEIEVSNNRE